ncbi:hypothetical protein BTN50_1244 [Candidatus Enterovibrio altilux]|uniref:Mobile element protein n=1 Tax=Candidatus Enterovibrio altilux TaxID=1927128 RepID=A0A291B9R0_9GAMM|nr:hypothetical protein BTN50_1244 [Candidatus Enterovibrio luxaltus]
MNKRVKTVNVTLKTKTNGSIHHLAIGFARLKVYGAEKRKVRSIVLMETASLTSYI